MVRESLSEGLGDPYTLGCTYRIAKFAGHSLSK